MDSERGYSAPGERIKAKSWVVGEGLCRPHLAEGSVKGVSVLQHRRERREGAEGEIWVREPKVARYA